MAARVSKQSDLVEIAGQLRRETAAAFLILDGLREVWVPKSQVEHDGHGIFAMPMWLAREKGLI